MPKVIATAQIEDAEQFEKGFRTHGELYRSQTISKPIHYSVEGDRIVICFEPQDLGTYLKILDSPTTAEAMALDGVKKETVKIVVLDRELEL